MNDSTVQFLVQELTRMGIAFALGMIGLFVYGVVSTVEEWRNRWDR